MTDTDTCPEYGKILLNWKDDDQDDTVRTKKIAATLTAIGLF